MGAKKQAIKDMSEEGIHTSVIYIGRPKASINKQPKHVFEPFNSEEQ